jgi:hypothetical protein
VTLSPRDSRHPGLGRFGGAIPAIFEPWVLRRGGALLVETLHRDTFVAYLSREGNIASRLPDGTLFLQEPRFDAGRAEFPYFWQRGVSKKRSSVRIYSVTELVRLVERAGLRFRYALHSLTGSPFEASGPRMGGRVTLVAERG